MNQKYGFANGKGIYHYANGNRYEGNYKDGKRDGKGTEYYVNEIIKSGMWEKGEYIRK